MAHDKRISTLQQVIDSALKVDLIGDLEIFCFDTEKKTIEMGKKNNLKVNSYKRPEVDKQKISCSYKSILTGMWEGELMQLSFLRNIVLEKAMEYSYLFWIDADIICPRDSIKRLLKLNSDIAFGWYFHKRIPLFPYPSDLKEDELNKKVLNGEIITVSSGGNGGVLFSEKVFKYRYDLYNGNMPEDGMFYEKTIKDGLSMKLDLGLNYEHIGDDYSPKAKQYMEEKKTLWKI